MYATTGISLLRAQNAWSHSMAALLKTSQHPDSVINILTQLCEEIYGHLVIVRSDIQLVRCCHKRQRACGVRAESEQ